MPNPSLNNEFEASVVVCVYNRPVAVVECLDSLLQLEAKNWELVLVDDCSSDDTRAVLEEYRDTHSEVAIKVTCTPENKGVSGARNAGIEEATGRYVFFTDSDCTVDPDWLTAHLKTLYDSTASAVAGRVIDDPPRNWAERAKYGGSRIASHRFQGRKLIGCNMGFSRQVLESYRFDDALTCYCDEDDLARRLANDGHQFAFVPDAVVYHHHPFTLSSFLRLAWRQGRGSAHFWWKHKIFFGRDVQLTGLYLLCFLSAFFLKPLLVIASFLFVAQLAALLFNETRFKGKSIWAGLSVLPLLVVANQVKTLSVIRFQLPRLIQRDAKNGICIF